MRIHADHQPYRKKPYVARWYEAAAGSAKATPGKLRQRNKSYIAHVRRALADLEAEFGNRLVRDFATEELRDYLFGLPYGAITFKNRTVEGSMFNYQI